MRLISATLLFAIFTLFTVSTEAHGRSSTVSVQIHKEKKISGAGFKIKFVEMVEDSRCPEGTTCVWAGNAKVKIQLRGGRSGPKTVELNTTTETIAVTYEGYNIKLKELTPKPAVNVRINPNGYVATFEILKSGK